VVIVVMARRPVAGRVRVVIVVMARRPVAGRVRVVMARPVAGRVVIVVMARPVAGRVRVVIMVMACAVAVGGPVVVGRDQPDHGVSRAAAGCAHGSGHHD